jgi:hypothetical protein
MKTKYFFLIVCCMAILVRLFLNFHISLLPGINGGYYPVQIRSILESGHMAISDMPLFFYLSAFVTKICSLILPNYDSNTLIIVVIKILDSIALPLMLIPFFLIQKKLFKSDYSKLFILSLITYLVLSFTPLLLTSEALKNAAGLALMLLFFYHYLSFLKYRTKKSLFLSIFVLLIIGITHFGVFTISILSFVIGLIIFFKRKAVIPIILVSVISFVLVAIFDFDRARSLLFMWTRAFTAFFHANFMKNPPGIFNYFSSYILIGIIVTALKRQKSMPEFHRNALRLFLVLIILLSLPFYNFELGRRLGLMLIIPQSLALLILYPYLKKQVRTLIVLALFLVVSASLITNIVKPKTLAITHEAYVDLIDLGEYIPNPDKSIVFARHGIEWWLAWEHRTKIAHPHIEIDEAMKEKYEAIYILRQKQGIHLLYPGKRSPFRKPEVPENGEQIYNSAYFDLYKITE